MIPTIDFSLIGLLALVFSFFKTVWGYFTQALNWITQRALALMIGSRIWATVFFFGIASAIYIVFTSWLSSQIGAVVSSVITTSFDGSGLEREFAVANQIIPVEKVTELLAFALGLLLSYITVVQSKFFVNKCFVGFNLAMKAWKT